MWRKLRFDERRRQQENASRQLNGDKSPPRQIQLRTRELDTHRSVDATSEANDDDYLPLVPNDSLAANLPLP
jgi:hypothetical protein